MAKNLPSMILRWKSLSDRKRDGNYAFQIVDNPDMETREAGKTALVMELADEGDATLHDLIARRGALPADEVLDVFLDIASALAFAHDKGASHNDLKVGGA